MHSNYLIRSDDTILGEELIDGLLYVPYVNLTLKGGKEMTVYSVNSKGFMFYILVALDLV